VYNLAVKLGVLGQVRNTPGGVVIAAQGPNARRLVDLLRKSPPRLAQVARWRTRLVHEVAYCDFSIVSSARRGAARLDVTPDIATCADCLGELSDPADRRAGYAFTNCTQCGPRYSIVTGLPYDRPSTTMAGFKLCPDCRSEYLKPSDRRFHAQPVCCPACGPHLYMLDRAGRRVSQRAPVDHEVLERVAAALVAGRLVAIKSLGGFQIACRADSDRAVARLRRLKDRPTKPLALMCRSVAAARRLVRINRSARSLLESVAAPVVLLPRRPAAPVSGLVAPGTDRLGVMLPYTPLHRLLFDTLRSLDALVMTSANRRGEPIAVADDDLPSTSGSRRLVPFDLALSHNRPIANRCDDSVVLADRPPVMVRRARGYTPEPIPLAPTFHVKQPVLAVGADGRNSFALAAGRRLLLSPYLGDMGSAAVEAFFEATLDRYLNWYRVTPKVVACDLHPDYSSTRLAERLADRFGAKLLVVQHHLAHILSVIAEHGLTEPVLGLAADGTGYGSDGNVWGCELLLVRPGDGWSRVGHLDYLAAADGGAELADPVRVAASYLEQAGEGKLLRRLGLQPGKNVPGSQLLSSSLGRLFDAAAAITGICRRATFEGEAAVALEAAAGEKLLRGWFRRQDLRGIATEAAGDQVVWDPRRCLVELANASVRGADPSELSARFHQTVSAALAELVVQLCRRHGVPTVALSGGSINNTLIRRRLEATLRLAGLKVHRNVALPLGDGGIAAGQAIATGTVSCRHGQLR
jgi:hydrogenase maturation protein HypF